jgi:inorganic pyrophosphatase
VRDLTTLAAHDDEGTLRVVVETPRGSALKLKYEPELGAFVASRRLALGVTYPYDWGFVPGTRAEDGDPLDAMVLHDLATYPGVVFACHAVGVLRLTQSKEGQPEQDNDRLIVIPSDSKLPRDARHFDEQTRDELAQFFLLAVLETGKHVQIRGWQGPEDAERLVQRAERLARGG